ncbi:MAG: hypothetical protein RIQ79_37 [Verrucomicrobiota bacterium]
MSAIFSLVRKDLRLLRWPWLGYLAVLLTQLALAAWCVLATRFTAKDHELATQLNLVLNVAQGLLTYVLVLRLVQADAPLRTRAFWRTRPISGGGLLTAKVLAAFLLFGLAPVLVWSPWWLVNGLRGADLALAAADVLFWQTLIILPAFLLASLVDSFGRAVLWSVVQAAMIICFALFPSSPYVSPVAVIPNLSDSRMVPVWVMVALVFPALVVWQFLRRRTAAVLTGYALLYLAAVAITLYLPYDFKPRTPGRRTWNEQHPWTELHPEVAQNFTLRAVSAKYYHGQNTLQRERAWVGLNSHWTIEGVPAGFVVSSHVKSLDFKTGDGRTFRPDYPKSHVDFTGAFASLKAQMKFPPAKIDPVDTSPGSDTAPTARETESSSLWIRTELKPNEIALLRAGPPAVTTELSVSLEKLELRFDAPLSPGVWHTDANGGLRIASVEAPMNGITVRIVTTHANSRLRDFWDTWRDAPRHPFNADEGYDYLFVQRDEARPTYLDSWGIPLQVGGIDIKRINKNFSPSEFPLIAKGIPNEAKLAAWRAGLRLARIAYHEEARFKLAGRSEALEITGSPEAPTPKL